MSEKLKVISKSEDLVIKIYEISKLLPKSEQYILISQMCRSAISIPSNIAEGSQRTKKEFAKFVRIARGSLEELKTQFNITERLYHPLINDGLFSEIKRLMEEIGKMTHGLLKTLT